MLSKIFHLSESEVRLYLTTWFYNIAEDQLFVYLTTLNPPQLVSEHSRSDTGPQELILQYKVEPNKDYLLAEHLPHTLLSQILAAEMVDLAAFYNHLGFIDPHSLIFSKKF